MTTAVDLYCFIRHKAFFDNSGLKGFIIPTGDL